MHSQPKFTQSYFMRWDAFNHFTKFHSLKDFVDDNKKHYSLKNKNLFKQIRLS